MLILASNSPRRRQLIGWLGIPFKVMVADIDETPLFEETPSDYTFRLAQGKALAIAGRLPATDLILAADTTVAFQSKENGRWSILGKPVDAKDAQTMLERLRACTHQVFTAVSLARGTLNVSPQLPIMEPIRTEVCVTNVTMRNFNQVELLNYIASGDPLDKAGAYAIQHAAFHPVEKLQGCATSVVGLPVCLVVDMLKSEGLVPPVCLPASCHPAHSINCLVFQNIFH